LGHYANRLSDVGRHEEALDYARKSLEIRERLAEKNPDRYEPDYAGSLGNYANGLSDVGRYEEALDHARTNLEIQERLAEKNSDRHEPAYAWSLGDYANRLSDVGEDEEALDYAGKSLEIYERFAKKNPKRFAGDFLTEDGDFQLLAWLCNRKRVAEVSRRELLEHVSARNQPLIKLYAAFVSACWAANSTVRNASFKTVFEGWDRLSVADRKRAEPYWLCAAAWSSKFESLETKEWVPSWHAFVTRRHGHVPAWMTKIAKRLNFSWPS
jgi:tetratricopeptide (TPR) repeat protein